MFTESFDMTKVGELDTVVLLQVLLRTRMRVLMGNLTDQEKERKEEEAKKISDKRLQIIVAKNIKPFFGDVMKDLFLYIVQNKDFEYRTKVFLELGKGTKGIVN